MSARACVVCAACLLAFLDLPAAAQDAPVPVPVEGATDAQPSGDANDEIGFGDLSGPPGDDISEPSYTGDANDEIGFGGTDRASISGDDDDSAADSTFAITLRADSAIWTERLGSDGFAKLRFTADPRFTTRFGDFRLALGVRAEGDAAYLSQRTEYDQATIDTYAWVVRAGETFVAWDRPRGELAAGFQTVSWGAGEALTVVDLINPRDLREPGLTAIEDARIPVLMTRAAFFGPSYRVEIIATHQTYFRLVPPPFGTWSPIRAALLQDPELIALGIADALRTKDIAWRQHPSQFSGGAQSIAARVVVDRGPASMGAYAGLMIDPQGVASLPDMTTLANDQFAIPLDHRRFGMFATSLIVTHRAIAVFGELAVDVQRPINVLADDPVALFVDRRTLLRWLAGGRYVNDRGGVLTVEYAQGTLHEFGRSQLPPVVPTSVATVVSRYEHTFGSDRWRFSSALAVTGRRLQGGAFGRAELSYLPLDGLRISFGYAVYLPTDEPSAIRGFKRNDRAMLSIRWDDAWSF